MNTHCSKCKQEDKDGNLLDKGPFTCSKCIKSGPMTQSDCGECGGKKCREWRYYTDTDSLQQHCSLCKWSCCFVLLPETKKFFEFNNIKLK